MGARLGTVSLCITTPGSKVGNCVIMHNHPGSKVGNCVIVHNHPSTLAPVLLGVQASVTVLPESQQLLYGTGSSAGKHLRKKKTC